MTARFDVMHHLRNHIIGELHVGRVRPGDRLAGIREVAQRLKRNPRTVAHAYRELEEEGLVEVRGRSGVYVAQQDFAGTKASEATTRWVSEFIAQGWERNVSAPRLADLLQRCTRSVPLRCGLVEDVEDAIVAIGYELIHDWGFACQTIDPRSADRDDLSGIDFFMSTSFYASRIHDLGAQTGKPSVVLTVHNDLQAAIRGCLHAGALTVVAVDPAFEKRLRIAYANDIRERTHFRVILANDTPAIDDLSCEQPVLLTRAAHDRLGSLSLCSIIPHSPTLSAETARSLAAIMVRGNLIGSATTPAL